MLGSGRIQLPVVLRNNAGGLFSYPGTSIIIYYPQHSKQGNQNVGNGSAMIAIIKGLRILC
jgi:hypothetical protein